MSALGNLCTVLRFSVRSYSTIGICQKVTSQLPLRLCCQRLNVQGPAIQTSVCFCSKAPLTPEPISKEPLSFNGINPLLVSKSPFVQQLRLSSSQQWSKNGRNIRRNSVHTKNRPQSKIGKPSVSSTPKNDQTSTDDVPAENEKETEKLTLYQRFKQTYKEHGKVLVVVHVATSIVWFGSFYTAVSCGFDIIPLLESWNLSERVISPFRSGSLGNVALAYLLYKLATPARYTVTIGGTKLAIRYLQKEGKMKTVPKEDSLRSLYKEGKEDLKDRSKRRIQGLNRRARRVQKRIKDRSKRHKS